jgi:hypothetical protein
MNLLLVACSCPILSVGSYRDKVAIFLPIVLPTSANTDFSPLSASFSQIGSTPPHCASSPATSQPFFYVIR